MEHGYSNSKFWSIKDWDKHLNKGKGIYRYDTGIYKDRNVKLIQLLKRNKNILPNKLNVFEFAGAGGYLAKRLLDNFKINKYLHTDYSDLAVNHAKNILNDYDEVTFKKLNIMDNMKIFNYNDFNLITSTSTGYILNNKELFSRFKKGTYVLLSFPKGWKDKHMIRFPSEYAISRYYRDIIVFEEIENIVYYEHTRYKEIMENIYFILGMNFYINFTREKYICLGKII